MIKFVLVFLLFSVSWAGVTKATLCKAVIPSDSNKFKCYYKLQHNDSTVVVRILGECPWQVTIDTELGRIFW